MKSTKKIVAMGVVVSLFASGCSYVFMTKPDRIHSNDPTCVSSKLAPGVDTFFTLSNGSGTIYSAIYLDDFGYSSGAVAAWTMLGIVQTIVWGASAASGFKRAQACENARRDHEPEDRYSAPTPQYDRPSPSRSSESTQQDEEPSKSRPNVDKYRTNIDQEKYMLVEEVAEYCDAETDTIWEFVEDGILDAYHTEYGIRFPKKDVRETCRNADEGGKQEADSTEYMSLKEAAMHCGTSRKNIWSKIDDGTLSTHQTDAGFVLLAEEVKAECGKEPEVPMD